MKDRANTVKEAMEAKKKSEKYSAIIVEDEPIEEEMLEDMVRSGFPEISQIYSSANGLDALRLIQKKEPEIILLDINIPRVSGIDILKELSAEHYEGQVVITTAYDSFEYAQKALNYGACGYLLKPVSDEELKASIRKCFENIRKTRSSCELSRSMKAICSYAQKYLIRDFISGSISTMTMASAYGWPDDGNLQARMLRILFAKPLARSRQKEILGIVQDAMQSFFLTLTDINENELICLFQPDAWKEQGNQDPRKLDVAAWCAMSLLVNTLIAKQAEYLTGMQMVFTGICRTYQELHDEIADMAPLNILVNTGLESNREKEMRIRKAAQRLKERNARRAVNTFHLQLENGETVWGGLYLLMKAVLLYREDIDVMDGFLAFDEMNPMGSMTVWLEGILKPDNEQNRSIHSIIEEAEAVMKKEFASPLFSQSTLAERFGLSSAYFSRKFKKETGENFSSELTKIRMEQAKIKLDEGRSVSRTAKECGYANRAYFSEIFKNYYGISASQYESIVTIRQNR